MRIQINLPLKFFIMALIFSIFSACGGGGNSSGNIEETANDNAVNDTTASNNADTNNPQVNEEVDNIEIDDTSTEEIPPIEDIPDPIQPMQQPSTIDISLAALITEHFLDDDILINREIPDITSDLSQLGKKLFFSKSLGGNFDTACASCHHPSLGGSDALSLPIGVGAIDPRVLGQGRENVFGIPLVPRNSPTNFNVALWDTGLFHDSRVESLGKEALANGSQSGIRTPDSDFGLADPNTGSNLVSAQAGFPVTSSDEMKTESFENGSDNATIRNHLAARIGNYGIGANELERNEWLEEFRVAFGSTASAESLVTFRNIALALGEYQRSLIFINSPWRNYLNGDLSALNDSEKRGANLFFTNTSEGGAGCASCHNGPLLSDGQHHVIAFPQIGPGKGDGNNDDFGRARETNLTQDRYHFRTPSLLNVAKTAPYGHSGSYQTLTDVVRHYDNPRQRINNYFTRNAWCDLPQFTNINNCETLYPNAEDNTNLALRQLQQEQNRGTSLFQPVRLNGNEVGDIVNFLESLTDPCTEDISCLNKWIANSLDDNPDDQLLIGRDASGNIL